MLFFSFFFFKQKTAYEMRISDWSSDVCSSDLPWNAVREAFADPEFPAIGADFLAETCPDDARARIVIFASMYDFDAYAVELLIQRSCPETLAKGPIGFEISDERRVGK